MNYPKLADLDTSHPQVAIAVEAAREWQKRKRDGDEGISMVFAGPNGAGKTHIAAAMQWSIRYQTAYDMEAEEVVEFVVPQGRFFKASDLLVELGPRTSENGAIIPPSVSYFVGDAPIIIVDDLGAQISMPFIKGEVQQEEIQIRLFLLVEHCINRTITTRDWQAGVAEVIPYPPSLIITTNLDIGGGDKSEFADYVGERVWSRLQDMCPKGFMINMRDVPDFRKQRSGR